MDGRLVAELTADDGRAIGLGPERDIAEHPRPGGSELAALRGPGCGSRSGDPWPPSVCSGISWPETHRPAWGSTSGPGIHPRMGPGVDFEAGSRSGSDGTKSRRTALCVLRAAAPTLHAPSPCPVSSGEARTHVGDGDARARRPTRDQDRRPAARLPVRRSCAAAGAARWRARGSAGARLSTGRLRQVHAAGRRGSTRPTSAARGCHSTRATRTSSASRGISRRRSGGCRAGATNPCSVTPPSRSTPSWPWRASSTRSSTPWRTALQRGRARARRLPRHRRARHPSARRLPHRAPAPACPAGHRDAIRSAPAARAPARPWRAPGDPGRGPPLLEDEADELLRSASVELPPGDVAELAERTEGWAAALRLAAVSLRGRPDQAELVHRFGASHRFVLDYVVEEVLAGLPTGTQEFLLRTSILDRLCGSLCDAVTGQAEGQARLEELERANLLIVPLDDERRWYRYHALFAEVLRARLAMLHPGDVPDLHARAAAWHEARGDDDEAISHVLQSGDLAHACVLVAEASLRHLNAGELSTVRRWLDALPPESVRSDPQLSVSYAWCLALAGETDGVADRLADAERALAAGHARRSDRRRRDPHPARPAALAVGGPGGRPGDRHRPGAPGPRPGAGGAACGGGGHLAGRCLGPARPGPGVGGRRRGRHGGVCSRAARPAGGRQHCSRSDARSPTWPPSPSRAAMPRVPSACARGSSGVPRPTSAATKSGAVWAALARARLELGQVEPAEAAARRSLELATRAGDAQVARSARSTLERIGPLRFEPRRRLATTPHLRRRAAWSNRSPPASSRSCDSSPSAAPTARSRRSCS